MEEGGRVVPGELPGDGGHVPTGGGLVDGRADGDPICIHIFFPFDIGIN